MRPSSHAECEGSRWLVVGLGNPGDQYSRTRHNIGFMVLDLLAEQGGLSFRAAPRPGALTAEGVLGLQLNRVVLLKPQTFMNRSGAPTASVARYYGLQPERLIVVHDDIDLPFGAVRLKCGGGAGGHNGVSHIAQTLGTRDFFRIRLGIQRPGRAEAAHYVLSRFSAAQNALLPPLLSDGAEAVIHLMDSGLVPAQQRFHATTPP